MKTLPGTLCLLVAALSLQLPPEAGADQNWDAQVEEILSRIKAPQFASRDFPITDFGAKSGEDCTEAIAKAIDRCNAEGGGRVVIPEGTWRTGAIHLKSNVNLHVSEGATLKFDPDPRKYLPVVLTRFEGIELMNYSPLIYALEQENVGVTGKGTLDGSADWDTWWAWNDKNKGKPTKQVAARNQLNAQGTEGVPVADRVHGEGSFLRPSFIQPYRCRNVLIEGITIVNSPMWEIHPVLCTNVTVRDATVRTLGPNNDGCNPESCQDVLIENCFFETGDDCIAIKSGRNNDGRRVNVPSENIVIRGCTMKDGHGGITMGSEISGDVRNVFATDCEMDSPNLDRAIRFKSNAVRGGVIENINVRNIKIGRVGKAILSVEFNYEEGADGPHQPTLRRVRLSNISSESTERVLLVTGIPAAIIEDIELKDCSFRGVEEPDLLKHAGRIALENVTIGPEDPKKK